jgi:hypothetical protein
MSNNISPSNSESGEVAAAVPAFNPKVIARPVTDPAIIERGRGFAEAVRQTRPLAELRSREAAQAAGILRRSTARARGLRIQTARAQANRAIELEKLIAGPNNGGKAKEVLAALAYRDMHAGLGPSMVNQPKYIPRNVQDVRIAPDAACKRDLLFQVRTDDGLLLTRPGGQVKTGSPEYLARKLAEMARKPDYGHIGIVDARFANADGSPRVASDAFTTRQAEQLRAAKVELRGVPDLDARGDALVRDIKASGKDGLDPVARRRLETLREDIARAYGGKGVASRALGGAAIALATTALVSLLVQASTEGEVDFRAIGEASAKAVGAGAAGALADAVAYHAARHLGMTAEGAKALAQEAVAVGFCLLAVATDAMSEYDAAAKGEISAASAVCGTSVKAILDLLPLALARLGWAGVPILLVAQVGGRWVLAKWREADRQLEARRRETAELIANMDKRFAKLRELSDENDRIFAELMGDQRPGPQLRVVQS